MKIKLIFFAASFCILSFTKLAYSQVTSTYSDAVTLLNSYNKLFSGDTISIDNIYDVLSKYEGKTITQESLNEIAAKNSFLKTYLDKISSNTKIKSKGNSSPTVQNALSTLGGLNVTNIADGIAKFLIERGKEEISTVFFERFKEDLKKYPELAILFPNASLIINNIESYNLLNLTQQLKDAFTKDLLNTPTNVYNLKDIDCGNDNLKCKAIKQIFYVDSQYNKPNTKVIIPLLFVQGIINGDNIIDILNNIATNNQICKSESDTFAALVKLNAMLLSSLGTTESGGLFISNAQVNDLFQNDELSKIFFGLVYAKYSRIDCFKNLILGKDSSLIKILESINNKKSNCNAIFNSFDKINSSYKSIQKLNDKGTPVDKELYLSFASASLDLIDKSIASLNNLTGSSKIDTFHNNMIAVKDICSSIQQNNYSGIFNSLMKFIQSNELFKSNKELNERLVKYLAFASNMASASNSDEIKQTIIAVALPSGSFSVKQKSKYNISLNGYIGYGFDATLRGTDFNNWKMYSQGIYAPVGFSFNKGLNSGKGGSIGIFTSLIDVGSIASFRIINAASDSLKQEIRLESIFSPGVQLIYTIPTTPITLCVGWRNTPKLFYSKPNGFEVFQSKSTFNFSILIDIPFFTIKNTPF